MPMITTGRSSLPRAAREAMQSSASQPSETMQRSPKEATMRFIGSICATSPSGAAGRLAL